MSLQTLSPFAIGTVIGPYRIANILSGGAVAEALDISTNRRWALKRLPDSLTSNPDRLAEYRQWIQRQVDLALAGTLGARGVEVHDGIGLLVTEFATRGSVVDQVRTLGRLPWLDATRRMIDASRAIEGLHAHGIGHGNIRPSNLLLNEQGQVRVSDASGGWIGPSNADYTAPETPATRKPTAESDVYSLGATYFALLAGHAPYADADGEAALARAHADEPIPNVLAGAPEIPLRCDAIIRRAMAKNPAERYPSVSAFRSELEAVSQTNRKDAAAKPIDLQRALSPPRRPWRQRLRGKLPSASLIVLVGLCAGAYYVFPYFHKPKGRSTEKAESAPRVSLPTVTNSLESRFIRVPAGVYPMGDPMLADARRRLVRITHPFHMGATEVTQREFQWVMGRNPSHTISDGNPVDSVTWAEAREYCERLSQLPAEKNAGRIYRLPTEAEWEYCCRAGTTTHFAFGNSIKSNQANLRIGGLLRSTPATTYPPNAWGFYDMHGNLWEWCSDWYKSEYYAESPVDDPQGPPTGNRRVLRGGSWMSGLEDSVSAKRNDAFGPDERSPDVGFRVVCIVSGIDNVEK